MNSKESIGKQNFDSKNNKKFESAKGGKTLSHGAMGNTKATISSDGKDGEIKRRPGGH